MHISRRTPMLAAILALAGAAPAAAAPDRSAQLTAEKPSFAWTGEPVTSVSGALFFDADDPAGSCGAYGLDLIDKCDMTHVSVDGPGSVAVTLPEAGDGLTNDWDLYVYEADAEGTPGAQLGFSYNIGAPEAVYVDAGEAANFLVVAIPYQAVNGGFTGDVTFTPYEEDPAEGP